MLYWRSLRSSVNRCLIRPHNGKGFTVIATLSPIKNIYIYIYNVIRNQCLIASIPLDRWIAYYLNIRLKFLGSWFSRSYLPHSINCVQICRLMLWIINPPFIDPYVQGINPDPLTSYSLLILIFNSLNSLPLTTLFNCLFPLRHTWIYFVFLQFYSQVSMLNWKSVKPKQKRYPCIAQWM